MLLTTKNILTTPNISKEKMKNYNYGYIIHINRICVEKTVLRSAVSFIFVYLQINMGLSIYYVIRDRGGGLPNLLQYYIGGSSKSITILQIW